MTTFDEREHAMEEKYFHDEELKFKVISRRRKFLGLWAAQMMHMNEEGSLQYALDIVRFGVEDNRDGAVIKRVLDDMQAKGLKVTEAEVRQKMTVCGEKALKQILEGA